MLLSSCVTFILGLLIGKFTKIIIKNKVFPQNMYIYLLVSEISPEYTYVESC
jgi:hypothetical protein